MARFTLLEVHLDGAQFTANAPFSGSEESGGAERSIEASIGQDSESDESSSSPMGLVVGLVVLAGAVAVARRLLSDEDSELAETEAEEPIIAD